MDSNMQSPTPDNVETKAAFRKPSNHVGNRKYRRRSPVNGSSSSEGSPKIERDTSPFSSRGDPGKVSERQHTRKDEREDRDSGRSQYGKDSYRHFDRYSSRNSHGYSRHDEYSRHEKLADDEERHYQTSSRSGLESRRASHSDHTREESERGRLRDYVRNVDKHSRDRYDNSGHRSKDKERDSRDRQKFRDKDASPDRAGSGRKHSLTGYEDKDRDRQRRGRDGWDEKRDYRRSSGDYRNDHAPYYEESRANQNDSGRGHDEHLHRDSYKDEQKEKKKYDDCDANRVKDRYNRESQEQNEDKPVFGGENLESLAKKPKLFSSERDPNYKDGNEKQSLKQVEADTKVTGGQAHVNNSEVANDLNAAKVAAMKAAELVNRNLVGVGFMSTEQKKKLLWGNKKSADSEESGHRWDTALFGDRERQEKFNKLMVNLVSFNLSSFSVVISSVVELLENEK
ncbi:hypothetical protein MANES_09G004100v8 [Manihot esculenta]|uniref:Uncharacterized protein n=1 Tax=Manihot esculenta TaxID=3983 RepID=A0ACB7H158_MANES|nr:hypothetical protein MANES_09G004100v8 [Manihot esculenta]